MANFEIIGRQSKSDKVWHHGYHRFYERFLGPLRETMTSMLEIGLDEGYSTEIWQQYFPKAKLYGFDLKMPRINTGAMQVVLGDQSRLDDLKRLASVTGKVDFIIDDGSHIPEHQIRTFDYLFHHALSDGGVYIVEDIETSYWKVGDCYGYRTNYGINSPKSCIEQFKPLIDAVNWEYLNYEDREDLTYKLRFFSQDTLSLIESVNFGQNCIIITKRKENVFRERAYRFRSRNP